MTNPLLRTARWIVMGLLASAAGPVAHHRLSFGPPSSPLQQASAAEQAPSDTRERVTLSGFHLADLEGHQHDLAEWRGKVVVLSFWATWCIPCRRDLPVFKALQTEYGSRGVQFVGIAMDSAALVRRYVFLEGLNYPQLVDYSKAQKLDRLLGNKLGALPFTVVLDREGRVAERVYGEWDHDEAASTLKRLL